MYRLIGKGNKLLIVEDHPKLGSVLIASVRGDIPEEVERAKRMIEFAERGAK